MKLPYNFFGDDKWIEDVAHIAIGFVPFLGWWREHRQWPPGDPQELENYYSELPVAERTTMHTQLDRVADSYRDFLGYALGDVLRTVALVAWAVWG